MQAYKIDLIEADNGWHAILPDLLIVGSGANPETATADAVRKAEESAEKLIAAGLAAKGKNGALVLAAGTQRGKALVIAKHAFIEFGIRAVFLGVLLFGLFLVVRGDLIAQSTKFRDSVAGELAQLRNAISAPESGDAAVADRLKIRARQINERFLPAAKELRPLVDALIGQQGKPE